MKRGYPQVNRDAYGSTVVIEFRPNAPKWRQIADILKERVADGTYPADTPLPSEHELVREFGVARGTARKVLTKLKEEGVAYAERGLGTFVAPPEDGRGHGRRAEG